MTSRCLTRLDTFRFTSGPDNRRRTIDLFVRRF